MVVEQLLRMYKLLGLIPRTSQKLNKTKKPFQNDRVQLEEILVKPFPPLPTDSLVAEPDSALLPLRPTEARLQGHHRFIEVTLSPGLPLHFFLA